MHWTDSESESIVYTTITTDTGLRQCLSMTCPESFPDWILHSSRAFTLPPKPAGFVVLFLLAQGLSLICNNPTLPPLTLRGGKEGLRTFALRLHFRPGGSAEADRRFLTKSPLPSANTFGSIHYYELSQVLVHGIFTP
jgi:hypothetical protein